jgi:iron complex outermembrane receptor protein
MGCNRNILFAGTAFAGVLSLAAIGAPNVAMAQAASPPPSTQPPTAPPPTGANKASPSSNEVIVTGSRIKRTTFSSPSPMTVITQEQSQLQGVQDTTQILQLSAVASNAVQINNYFSQYVVTGGPGVNTLSLRGLGAQRSLILLDGQRMGPAGVGGTVGPIDLNTIPDSEIDHIDVEKDGASSIYGSDAVAGVVNIVTKTTQDGGDLHVYGNPSEHGGGNQYQVNGSWGKTGDKGYITVGFDYFRQDPLLLRQRSYLDCPQDLVTYQGGGGSADIIDPTTGKDKCWTEFGFAPAVEDLGSPVQPNVYISNPAAMAGGGPVGIDLPGWQAVGLQLFNPDGSVNNAATRASQALIPANAPSYGNTDAVSPVSRYTFTTFAGWDLTPHIQLYTKILFNERDSSQTGYSQFFSIVNPGNPNNPGFALPLPIIEQNEPQTQRVDYGRIVVGAKGDLPDWGTLKDWTYEVYGQYSLDDAWYTMTYVPQDRANAVTWAGPGTNGCDANAVNPFIGGESLAQAEPGVACVPVNLFAAVANGAFTPAEQAFLYKTATGHTTYNHAYIEGDFNGDIWQLPAGPLGAAVGFQVRREAIDDVPGADFINSNVYNETTEGVTKGSETTEDVYGELEIPVIKDVPFIYSLDLNLSGRFSNYSTYGADLTYKGTADWRMTDWFALRATYGTAFRAPELYELFLADQTGFFGQNQIDPCIEYGSSGVSPVIQKNCASLGIPANYAGAAPSATVFTGGGAGHLRAETSIFQTEGIVLTPHWGDRSINIAIDYYSFDIKNEISQFGAGNIVVQCMSANNFPNNPFCSLFTREGSGGAYPFSIQTVNDDYVNVAKENYQGLDLDITYKGKLPYDVDLTIDSKLDWTFYTNTILLNGAISNFLGSDGFPSFVGTTDFRFDKGPWTLDYSLYMIGHSDDAQFSSPIIPDYRDTSQTVIANYNTPLYTLSTVSLRRKFDKFTVEVGVKNLFDAAPPPISGFDSFEGPRYGNSLSAVSQYDYIGRSFFVILDAKF